MRRFKEEVRTMVTWRVHASLKREAITKFLYVQPRSWGPNPFLRTVWTAPPPWGGGALEMVQMPHLVTVTPENGQDR